MPERLPNTPRLQDSIAESKQRSPEDASSSSFKKRLQEIVRAARNLFSHSTETDVHEETSLPRYITSDDMQQFKAKYNAIAPQVRADKALEIVINTGRPVPKSVLFTNSSTAADVDRPRDENPEEAHFSYIRDQLESNIKTINLLITIGAGEINADTVRTSSLTDDMVLFVFEHDAAIVQDVLERWTDQHAPLIDAAYNDYSLVEYASEFDEDKVLRALETTQSALRAVQSVADQN
jgi:hypothetical protein